MPVLGEHGAEGAEGGGLDRVDADVEVLAVHLADEVGPREHEVLVAALERGAAEVVGAEVLALHPGAEGAVEDEDALAQGFEEVGHSPQGTGAVRALLALSSALVLFGRRAVGARAEFRADRRAPALSARAQSSRSPELSP